MNNRMLRYAVMGLMSWLGLIGTARAVVLDWNSVDWTAGGLSQSFEIDSTNPGNDITISIVRTGTVFLTGLPNDQRGLTSGGTSYPIANNTNETLVLATAGMRKNDYVTVTVTFNYTGGAYAALMIHDVDSDSQKGIDALTNMSGTVPAGGLVPLNVYGSASNTVTGSGTLGATAIGSANAGGTLSGDVSLDTGAEAVSSLTFRWSDNGNGNAHPLPQFIGIGNIRFTPVPEVGSGLVALLLCVGLVAGSRWRWTLPA